jgi:hypothetical protein
MPGETGIRVALGVVAAYAILTGLLALVAPDTFFDEIGRYGVENEHYVGDNGAFTLAYGLLAVVAIARPPWRVPILAVGAAWFGLHALNHLFDIGQARSDARGIADTALLALGALALAWLAVLVSRGDAEHGSPGSRPG